MNLQNRLIAESSAERDQSAQPGRLTMRIVHPALRLRGEVLDLEGDRVLVRVDGYPKNPVWLNLADVEDEPIRRKGTSHAHN